VRGGAQKGAEPGALISMIDALMYGALGFFSGCLLALMLAPPLWNRAVKLTTRRLEATMPMTLTDIQADKDQLRAEYAIELRKVEVKLEKAKEKAARELIEANKRRVEITMLNTDLDSAKAQLQENENANRVLQQTIKRRLPDLDTRLKAARTALAELESVNAELRTTVESQSDALKTARTTMHSQRADIERLRNALEGGSNSARGLGKRDAQTIAETQHLNAELSKAQEDLARAQTSAEENALLRRELSQLAGQILTVARAQGLEHVQSPETVTEVAEVYVEQEEEEAFPAEAPPEQDWQAAQNGNGAELAAEEETTERGVDFVAAAMGQPGPTSEDGETEQTDDAAEDEEPKGLARRFIGRREARRARKAGGASLTERLRGLIAE
jgi:chromosome segregation ATPase